MARLSQMTYQLLRCYQSQEETCDVSLEECGLRLAAALMLMRSARDSTKIGVVGCDDGTTPPIAIRTRFDPAANSSELMLGSARSAARLSSVEQPSTPYVEH